MTAVSKASRLYICHTFYHVYVTLLKELNLPPDERGNADVLLSTMSNDFEDLDVRLSSSGLFGQVHFFHERNEKDIPGLERYHRDRGNILANLFQRMIFCREYAKAQEELLPVDPAKYRDIYVFCDSDPIGYYLNYKKIYYHALEDGLDCLAYYDTARYDNRGHFPIKAWFARHGLIFIQNGYSKYCLDMEVNNISILKYGFHKYREVPRQELIDALSPGDKALISSVFVRDFPGLCRTLSELPPDRERILILTEPLCDPETRERIFRDIIDMAVSGTLSSREPGHESPDPFFVIKPHPRDVLDYGRLFPEHMILQGKFPMEVINYIPGIYFHKVISVYTVVDSIECAGEKIYLGDDFMDKYEAPEIHRQNEYI